MRKGEDKESFLSSYPISATLQETHIVLLYKREVAIVCVTIQVRKMILDNFFSCSRPLDN